MTSTLASSPDVSTRQPYKITRYLLASMLILGLLVATVGCADSPVQGNPNPDPITPPEFQAPAAPSTLVAESRDAQVALTWEASEDADAYFVYRSTSSMESLPDSPLSDRVTSTSYTDNSVSNGTTYYYRVTAVDRSSAESAASGEAAITPFANPPGTPE